MIYMELGYLSSSIPNLGPFTFQIINIHHSDEVASLLCQYFQCIRHTLTQNPKHDLSATIILSASVRIYYIAYLDC